MMEPQEQLERAHKLCQRLRNVFVQTGPRDRQRTVRGTDPNELKKLYTFLLKHRDLGMFKKLVDTLPTSHFAKRSGMTEGYFKNIQSSFGRDFYSLDVDDAVVILGWVCRLL